MAAVVNAVVKKTWSIQNVENFLKSKNMLGSEEEFCCLQLVTLFVGFAL